MAGRASMSLKVRIPPYRNPPNQWRKEIYEAVLKAVKATGMKLPFDRQATLEVRARLYFSKDDLRFHDVDNRLKDIMDALQGRMGGPKKFRKHAPIIPNDWQIFRAEIQKGLAPPQSKGRSHLEIRRLR